MSEEAIHQEMTCSVKYIFIDVVQFTHHRNVEAQSHIVKTLNEIVLEIISKHKIDKETPIYIPTGDGICIALKNTEGRFPFDIQMLVALDILTYLKVFNDSEANEMRKFQVRIGLNANEDNLITDINGRENVAGAGISLASRIMDKADGNQILVGESVYDRLQQREKYMDKLKLFPTADKHGKPFRVYQYIEEGHPALSTETPQALITEVRQMSEPKLSLRVACYFAHAIVNRDFLIEQKGGLDAAKTILLWMLAGDTVNEIEARGLTSYPQRTFGANKVSLAEQFEHYSQMEHGLLFEFNDTITNQQLFKYRSYFDEYIFWLINSYGKKKLYQEWPDIWNKFALIEKGA